MAEKQTLICDKCKVEMEEIEAKFSYLGRAFTHKVNRCPQCGQLCLDEELVTGRMSEAESKIEEK